MSDFVAAAVTAGGAVAAGMTATLYATGGGADVYVGLVLAAVLFVGAVVAVLLEQVG